MMLTNATITVYNRGYDPLTRFDWIMASIS